MPRTALTGRVAPRRRGARPRPPGSRARRAGCSARRRAARPGPLRSTSQSTTGFVRRPRPSISTSTRSPGRHRPGVGGRAGQHDVARLERDQPAEVGELVAVVPDDVVGAALLDDLAVQVRAQAVAVVGRPLVARDDGGADRQEAVLALDAQHRAAVGVAEVVQADVVRRREAVHVARARRPPRRPSSACRRRPRARPRS